MKVKILKAYALVIYLQTKNLLTWKYLGSVFDLESPFL